MTITNQYLADRMSEVLTRIEQLLLAEKFVPHQQYRQAYSDADPGTGRFRLNNATLANVTEGYFSAEGLEGSALGGLFDSYDESTSTTKGTLYLLSLDNPANWAVYRLTAVATGGAGSYRKLTLSHIGSEGAWTQDEEFAHYFLSSGDVGETLKERECYN